LNWSYIGKIDDGIEEGKLNNNKNGKEKRRTDNNVTHKSMSSKSYKEKKINEDQKSYRDGEDSMKHSEVIYELGVWEVSSGLDV